MMKWARQLLGLAYALAVIVAPGSAPAAGNDLRCERSPAVVLCSTRAGGAPANGGPAGLVAVGDIDGDELADLVEVRQGPSHATVRLRQGRNGLALWSYEAPRAYPAVQPFRMAQPGLLLTWRVPDQSGWQSGLEIVALRADGTEAWTFGRAGSTNGNTLVGATDGRLVRFHVGNMVAGGGDDVLIETRDYTNPALVVTALEAIDGRTGDIVWTQQFAGARSHVTVAGDVDGSGADDVAVVDGAGRTPSVLRIRSERGHVVWSSVIPGIGDPTVQSVPDQDGDGVSDLLVMSQPSEGLDEVPRATLVDGRTGSVRWVRNADWAVGVGDADGRAGSELVLLAHSATPLGWVQRMEGVSFDGTVMWSRRIPLHIPAENNGYGMGFFPAVGDADRDGVVDNGFGHTVWAADGSVSTYDGLVSGRTGELLWERDDRPLPIRASLDGQGDDYLLVSRAGTRHHVTAVDGASLAPLWSRSISGDGIGMSFVAAGDVNGDGLADILASPTDTGTQVLSGRDGRTFWTVF